MKTYLLLLISLLLMACGKGSQNSSPELFQETVSQSTYLDLVNAHRIKLNLPLLDYSPIIEEVAREHSSRMARNSVLFGHGGMRRRCKRLEAELKSSRCGEIVARGQRTSEEAFNAWLSSPPHRKTIEDRSYTHTGLAQAVSAAGVVYWTQIFLRIN